MAPTTTSPSDAKSVSKSDFIRTQSASMSAAQVVEKAKAEGIDLRAGLVYEVRRIDKARKTLPSKQSVSTARKAASKSRPAAPTRGDAKARLTTSKAAFVRAHANLSPKEIVEKAKGENIKLDVGYVYNVRSSNRANQANQANQGSGRRAPERRGLPAPEAVGAISRVEALLKAVAAEVGLGRAIELLQAERAKISAAIGG
jgi:hypothetical protein